MSKANDKKNEAIIKDAYVKPSVSEKRKVFKKIAKMMGK